MYHTHTQVYMYVRDSARGELTRVEGHGLPTESKKGTFSLSYFFFFAVRMMPPLVSPSDDGLFLHTHKDHRKDPYGSPYLSGDPRSENQ